MREILLSMLLVVTAGGFARAQQATGPAADQARKEVMQFEKEKVPLLLKGGDAFGDWFDKMDAADVVTINPGGSAPTKTEQVNVWRTGNMKQTANDQRDHKIFIYANGTVAVVTYVGHTKDVIKGVPQDDYVRCADTWVKQDGKWLRVVHANSDLRAKAQYFGN